MGLLRKHCLIFMVMVSLILLYIRDALFLLVTREDQCIYVVFVSRFSFAVFMDKSSTFSLVRRMVVHGHDGRQNDVVFCGSEAQQHVVFFPGDVQVRKMIFND